MAFLPYEEGVGQAEVKRTIFLCILLFAFMFISLFGLQIYNNGGRTWLKESREFHNLITKVSQGIAFCYSANSTTTAFAVTKDGWYITAGHKVNRDFPGVHKIYVKLDRRRDAKVYIAQKIIPPPVGLDLLLFKIDYEPKYYFKNFKDPHMFEESWLFGFRGPSGKALSAPGYVTYDISFPSLARTTARTAFGQSGGPIINRKGEVLGVAVLISLNSFDGLFIPSSQVKKYIRENLKK